MFTIDPLMYVNLFCFNRFSLIFTFILALSYTIFGTAPLELLTELIFSLDNLFDIHEETSLPNLSKYLYTD